MQSLFQLIMLIPTTLIVIFWIYLASKYEEKFLQITSTIDTKEYYMAELFYIGFQTMEIIHFNMKTEGARKQIKLMSEVYGNKYAHYYYYVLIGGQITYIVTILPMVCLLALLANNPMALFFGVIIGGLLVWYLSESFKDKLTARREKILADFPQMLSKLTLLVNSGMLLRDAWNLVAVQGNSILFQEMQTTAMQLDNGVSEYNAYREFGDRCNLKEVRKFASLVVQGLEKGGSDLTYFLKDMSDEMWLEKKNMVKRKGEQANSKLLIPTLIIFAGILLMIMAPILMGL